MTGFIDSKTCENVYTIMNTLNLLHKLPENTQKFLLENRDEKYKFIYDVSIPIEEQIDDKQTMIVLSYLFLTYINKDKKIEQILRNRYEENEIRYQDMLNDEYNPDDIFKKQEEKERNRRQEYSLTVISNEKWYQKFLSFFKNIFRR